MLISHNKKFIYLKAHKVAGTSVELLLEPFCRNDGKIPTHGTDEYVSDFGVVGLRMPSLGYKMTKVLWKNHDLPKKIINHFGEELYNTYLKICVIRNPFDLMVSLYHWRGNNKIDEKFFLEFLKKNKKDPIINNNKIFWGEKNIFYIKYENLKEDLLKLSNELNLNLNLNDLKHLKKSERKEYKLYYNEESKKIVQSLFDSEIKKFGYEF
jgi:hypothetical protein